MSGMVERLERMNLAPRMAEHGRIRLGRRNAQGYPEKLKTLRFTSSDRAALERVAGVYGGTVQEWDDTRSDDAYDLITESERVRIQLPPNPLGDTPILQLWAKGHLLRSCDAGDPAEDDQQGCLIPGPDGGREAVPCICFAPGGEMECKPKTVLDVILPDTDFGGVWRLSTSSVYAAKELPAMVALIEQVQNRTGLPSGWLMLEQRSTGKGKATKRFAVAKLILDKESYSGDAAALGGSETLVAIGSGVITDEAWTEFVEAAKGLDEAGQYALKVEAGRLGRSSIARSDMDPATVAALTLMAKSMAEEEDEDEGIAEAVLIGDEDG